MADRIVEAIHSLKSAGADFAAIATNTPHNAFDRISRNSPLHVISIMDATAEAIIQDGYKKVGLLGTKPTMEYGFFQRTFASYGIQTITPGESDRKVIDRVIWDELVRGIISPGSRKAYNSIIERMAWDGAEGVILGCTEIPLLVKQKDCDVKLYDTAALHASAILDYACE